MGLIARAPTVQIFMELLCASCVWTYATYSILQCLVKSMLVRELGLLATEANPPYASSWALTGSELCPQIRAYCFLRLLSGTSSCLAIVLIFISQLRYSTADDPAGRSACYANTGTFMLRIASLVSDPLWYSLPTWSAISFVIQIYWSACLYL